MKYKSKRTNLLNRSLAILTAVLTLGASILVLGFQNCSADSKYLASAKASGNGDGYGGMVTRYFYFDRSSPCTQRDVSGQPLPNGAIFSTDQYQLVRRGCQDLTPETLTSSEVVITAAGELTYQAKNFEPIAPSANLILAQSGCPTGHTVLPAGVRDNLILDSQELMSSNWYRHPGVLPTLASSILGVPLYSVSRNDVSLLDQWRRLSQFPDVLNSRTYALSFLAQPGSSSAARVMIYQANGLDLQVTVDLTTGLGSIVQQGATTGVEVQSSFVNGTTRFITVFFTPTVDPGNPDVGIAPESTGYGASILLSDIRLVETAGYCSP